MTPHRPSNLRLRWTGFIVLAALAGSVVQASAAQCGNSSGGFEAWKQQFAPEARAKGIGQAGISALMQTNYAQATINADRGQRSFRLSFDEFMAKRGGAAIIARGRSIEANARRAVCLDRAELRRPARAADRDLGNGDGVRLAARQAKRPLRRRDPCLRLPAVGVFHRSAHGRAEAGRSRSRCRPARLARCTARSARPSSCRRPS